MVKCHLSIFCEYEATANGSLAKHQRILIKKLNTVANIAAIKEFEKEIPNNTKNQYIRSEVPLHTLQLWGNYEGKS